MLEERSTSGLRILEKKYYGVVPPPPSRQEKQFPGGLISLNIVFYIARDAMYRDLSFNEIGP
jgi:hypothetical protein